MLSIRNALILISFPVLIGPRAASAASDPAGAPAVHPASDRKSVDLTVYNDGQALIREERILSLAKGDNRVRIPDIPATIDATSLHFAALADPSAVSVLEQNYQYDLVSQSKLLEKYLGKTVEFMREDPATRREIAVPGRILAVGNPDAGVMGRANPGMVAEINGKIELDPAGRLSLPALPEGLILKPQLEWLLRSGREGEQKAEISYLAGGISWSCDYVALLSKGDDKLDLTGWVTLTNNSGTAFRNAGLKLVAGDVHQVRPEADEGYLEQRMSAKVAAAPPQFRQKELFEYKLYSLQRRTDLGGAETKQIELVSAANASARKMLVYDGMDQGWRYWLNNPGYRGQESFGQQSNPKVGVYVAFRNDEKSGLGLPLPKGRVRVYKRDDDGKEQFIGEDMLDHTPKDEEVRLYLGNAFDVVGERARVEFKNLAFNRGVEETVRIKVRNHKREAAEVMIYEHPWRWNEWTIVKADAKYEKVDQSTLRFPVKIGPDQEKVVTYTVKYVW
jgi:hypothetical protein